MFFFPFNLAFIIIWRLHYLTAQQVHMYVFHSFILSEHIIKNLVMFMTFFTRGKPSVEVMELKRNNEMIKNCLTPYSSVPIFNPFMIILHAGSICMTFLTFCFDTYLELYDYCLEEKFADAALIAKWKKVGVVFIVVLSHLILLIPILYSLGMKTCAV